MRILSIDFETHAEADIKLGAYHYVTHPATRTIMMAWHFIGDPAPPLLWWHGQECPAEVAAHVRAGGQIAGWNSLNFERQVWRHKCVPDHGFPEARDDQWQDTMLRAVAANLPRSLEACASAVGSHVQKDKEGHKLMMELTNAKRTSWEALWSPQKRDKLIRFAAYCQFDVAAEEGTAERLPPWPDVEPWRRMPGIDMRINDRGIQADIPLIQAMRHAAEHEAVQLNLDGARLTQGYIGKLTETAKLKEWLLRQGVRLPLAEDPKRDPSEDVPESDDDEADPPASRYRLRKNDIVDLLASRLPGDRKDIHGQWHGLARDVLQLRADASKISVKKLNVMEAAAGADGRLRGSLLLMGAQATGRWSSVISQVHNTVRNTLPDGSAIERRATQILGQKPGKEDKALLKRITKEALADVIEVAMSGDPDLIRPLYGSVMIFVSRMIRRVLTARPGYTLLQGDFSQIEARIIAWLSGQRNIVEAFATGKDVYRIAAAPIFKKAPEDLTSEERQIGKVSVLGLGYLGGTGVFVVMAANYGIQITREEAKPLVYAWRKSNAEIVKFGYACYEAMVNAVQYPGHVFSVAPLNIVSYFMHAGALCCRLPSGRLLRYWAPLIEGVDLYGKPLLTVLRVRGKSVTRSKMWAGLSVENVTQAIAADLLACGLANMEDHGALPVVLHVHDSIDAEVPEDDAERLLPEFEAAMTKLPWWAVGFPLKADCHIGARFG